MYIFAVTMTTLYWRRASERSGPPKQKWGHCDVFFNQSQQILVILLKVLSCIFLPNLSKIGLLIFPWQHIFEGYFRQMQFSKSVMTSLWRHFFINLNKFSYHTYWCTKFQVDWRSDKGLQEVGPKTSWAENDQKSPDRIGLKYGNKVKFKGFPEWLPSS